MRTIFFILLYMLTVQSHAQKASFREIKLKPNPKYYNSKEATVIFPIIVTENTKIDKLINSQIREDMFQTEDKTKHIKNVLIEHINEFGLTDLSYEVSYNSSGILSFVIYAQGCGAYCSNWNTYFNFDLSTGKKISISDVISKNRIDSFRNIVRAEKIKLLTQYKIDESINSGHDGIDSNTVDWAIRQVDENCMNQVSIENFSISAGLIVIFDPCEFPHAIRSQEPEIDLKYSYSQLKEFLDPRFKKRLVSRSVR